MWQNKIQVEIEKTSYQLVLLLRGDELPRQQDISMPTANSSGGKVKNIFKNRKTN
jgi:hypothetical protein